MNATATLRIDERSAMRYDGTVVLGSMPMQ